MLTAIILLSVWSACATAVAVRERLGRRKLQAKLDRIGGTDDEILAVLEASDSPLSRKLLGAAKNADKPSLPAQRLITANEVFIAELETLNSDVYRHDVLTDWSKRAKRLSIGERARVLKCFDSDVYRSSAMKVLNAIRED